MSDALISLAATTFAFMLGDMVGAPYVELHDVMDPNQAIDEATQQVATALGVATLQGEPYFALLEEIIRNYENRYVL